ncbi:DUF2642 domain-containing protein [Paenibacillus marinisediminis]
MNLISNYLGQYIEIEVTGSKRLAGRLVDYGLDIIVIYDGSRYVYISSLHVQHMKLRKEKDASIMDPPEEELLSERDISYRKTLSCAKGQFIELYVSSNQTIHGYITNVLTNYFVFYSPIYKTMYIPLIHLKWLTYDISRRTPYSLDMRFLPMQPSELTLARTFEEQMKKLEGKIIVLDLGHDMHKQGLLYRLEGSLIELVTADEERLFSSIQHIQTVHSPYI